MVNASLGAKFPQLCKNVLEVRAQKNHHPVVEGYSGFKKLSKNC